MPLRTKWDQPRNWMQKVIESMSPIAYKFDFQDPAILMQSGPFDALDFPFGSSLRETSGSQYRAPGQRCLQCL